VCGIKHRRYVDPLEEFQEEVQSCNGYELRGSSRPAQRSSCSCSGRGYYMNEITSEKAQLYLDIAAVMFIVIDADREIRLVNKKACEILGYEKEEELIWQRLVR